MNYQEALDYLLRFADYERKSRSSIVWDLRRIERLLERMGNPQCAAKTVHVTGTKGKGSTVAMVESILRRAGYRTGMYTSPHLLSFTERIKINGQPITEDDWARFTKVIVPEVEAVNAEGTFGELTTFEIMTAMAFLYFREMGAEYQVIEVGLGGRLDATNVVRPEVCVLTSISYDHTDVLGETLDKISGEKAGIIKPGAVVVTAPQQPEAIEVIERVCREKEVRLVKTGSDITWKKGNYAERMQAFRVSGLNSEYDLQIPLLGEHQMENAAVAVATAEVLEEKGAMKITGESIIDGLRRVNCPGRLQVLHREPWLVVDEAHNAYSMRLLGKALREFFSYNKLILILGFGWDHDVEGMVTEAAVIADEVIPVASRHPKSVKPEELASKFASHGISAKVVGDISEAVKYALGRAEKKDLICATGSNFVVAEVLEEMV